MLHHHTRKDKTHHQHPDGRAFAWLTLLRGIGNSAFWVIFPLILMDLLKSEGAVGLYYSAIAVVTLLASVGSTLLFTRFSKVHITKVTLILAIVALVSMTYAEQVWHVVGLDIPRAICVLLFSTCTSLFVHEFATRESLLLDESRYYLFANIGWAIGPALGGYTAYLFGNQSIFLFVSFWFTVALGFFLHLHLVAKHPHVQHGTHEHGLRALGQMLKAFLSHGSLVRVMLVTLGVNAWIGVTGIYMPLALDALGYSQDIIGLVMTATIVPLVLLEGFVGRWAKRFSLRLFIASGFLLLAIITGTFPLFSAHATLLIIAFVVSNVGVALVEPLQESYYFKVVKRQQADQLFGIYNAASPAADILGPFCSALAFAYFGGFTGLWLWLAVAMLGFFVMSLWIRV